MCGPPRRGCYLAQRKVASVALVSCWDMSHFVLIVLPVDCHLQHLDYPQTFHSTLRRRHLVTHLLLTTTFLSNRFHLIFIDYLFSYKAIATYENGYSLNICISLWLPFSLWIDQFTFSAPIQIQALHKLVTQNLKCSKRGFHDKELFHFQLQIKFDEGHQPLEQKHFKELWVFHWKTNCPNYFRWGFVMN